MRKPRLAAEPTCGVIWNESSWKRGDGSQLALLSVMAKGDENCCELPKMNAIDNVAPEDELNVVQQSLFTDDGESAQEERDRKEQLEREQAIADAASKEETKGDEEKKGSVKKNNFFKRFYENIMNMGEDFFDEDKERNSGN